MCDHPPLSLARQIEAAVQAGPCPCLSDTLTAREQRLLEDFYMGLLREPNEKGLFYKANSVGPHYSAALEF